MLKSNFLRFLLIFFLCSISLVFSDTLSDYAKARKLFTTERMESYRLLKNVSQQPSEVRDFALYYYGQLSSREDSIPIYELLLSLYPDFILGQGLKTEIADYYFTKEKFEKLNADDIWMLAKAYNSRGRWADSKKAFFYWLDKYQTSDKLTEAYYLLAMNAVKFGENKEAFSYFDDVIETKDKDYIYLAKFQKAKLIASLKGTDEGIESYQNLREDYGENQELMALVLPEQASLYRINDRYHDAEECYVKFLKMFPNRDSSDEIRFQLARMLFISGNYESAEKYFKDITNKEELDQSYGSASLFIMSLMPQANPIRKKELNERLFKEYPWSYYGHLAAQYLGKKFRRNSDKFNKYIDIKTISPRAVLFLELGDDQTAIILLRQKYLKNTNNLPLALYMIELYEKNGDYYNALGISDIVWRNYQYKGKLDSMPLIFWEKANPLYYWEEVNREASKYDADPYMLLGLIRQESRFNSKAISKSKARGLMQLMQATAAGLARFFGLEEYDLDNPSTNIRFGVKYYAEMTKKHPNNVEYVLSCYNAGPNRTSFWVSENAHLSIEEFVETIPYTETRNYVKVIMRNYWNYRDLYTDNVYVGYKFR